MGMLNHPIPTFTMPSIDIFNCTQGADFLRKQYMEIIENLLSLNATIDDKLKVLKAKELEGACALERGVDWITPFTSVGESDTVASSVAMSDMSDKSVMSATAEPSNVEEAPCVVCQDKTKEKNVVRNVPNVGTCDKFDQFDYGDLDIHNHSDRKSPNIETNTRNSKSKEGVDVSGYSDQNSSFASIVGNIGRSLFGNAQDVVFRAAEAVDNLELPTRRAPTSSNTSFFKSPQRRTFRPAPTSPDCKKVRSSTATATPPVKKHNNSSPHSVETPFFFGGHSEAARWRDV